MLKSRRGQAHHFGSIVPAAQTNSFREEGLLLERG